MPAFGVTIVSIIVAERGLPRIAPSFGLAAYLTAGFSLAGAIGVHLCGERAT